jgi:GNAT superfamily N-acetyltransferase
MNDMTVRTACPRDEDGIVELCRLAHAEIGPYPFSGARVRDRVSAAVNKRQGVALVSGEPGNLTGMAIVSLDMPWYSREPRVNELVSYVRPEHRRSTIAKDFLRKEVEIADSLGAALICGVPAHDAAGGKRRLYERHLGETVGASFIFKPDGADPEELYRGCPAVRIATPDDATAVRDCCLLNHAENGVAPLDEDRLMKALFGGMTGQDGLVGIISRNGRVEGIVDLQVTQPWFSEQPVWLERGVYVHPQCRTRDHGAQLLRFAKFIAARNAMPLEIGVLARVRVAAKLRYYRREFGDPVSFVFLRDGSGAKSAD